MKYSVYLIVALWVFVSAPTLISGQAALKKIKRYPVEIKFKERSRLLKFSSKYHLYAVYPESIELIQRKQLHHSDYSKNLKLDFAGIQYAKIKKKKGVISVIGGVLGFFVGTLGGSLMTIGSSKNSNLEKVLNTQIIGMLIGGVGGAIAGSSIVMERVTIPINNNPNPDNATLQKLRQYSAY